LVIQQFVFRYFWGNHLYLVAGGSSCRWNDNVFLPEILQRKGLKWPIPQKYCFQKTNYYSSRA